MATMDVYTLVASKGCGSAIVEACLALTSLAHEVEELDHEAPGPARDRLLAINPLGQVPTMILPGGGILTESAAIALHVAEVAPAAGLVPRPGDPDRPRFLRWLAFLVGAVYPTFTYGDDPSRFVSGEAAVAELRASTDAYRERCWRQVEGELVPRRALVPGTALLRPRPLRVGDDPLAPAPTLVRRALPEAARDRPGGRPRPPPRRGLGAQLGLRPRPSGDAGYVVASGGRGIRVGRRGSREPRRGQGRSMGMTDPREARATRG
jgi:GST-like protein